MKAPEPLISVFMPCFNQQDFVRDAMDSVLSQDYDNIELVVGDDHSTDGTWAIVLEYQSKYPTKVKAFRNERNLGITMNCNELLRHCSGKYIAFHAGDDLYLPGKLSRQVAAMEAAAAVLSYHDIAAFDSETGNVIRNWNSGPESRPGIEGECRDVAARLIEDGTAFMAALSVMVLRSALPKYGYDERVRIASDWMMWIDVCARSTGRVIFLPQLLARYRRHGGSVSMKAMNYFDDELIVLALSEYRYPRYVRSIDKARARLRYRAAVHYLECSDEGVGRALLLRCLGGRPAIVTKALARWLASTLHLSQWLAALRARIKEI